VEAGINRIVPVINKTTRIAEHKPIYTVATSHMARRTFTSILYENVQDPNIIGTMTGHAPNSKAFARYRKIDDKVKRKAISFLI
jgi:integrase